MWHFCCNYVKQRQLSRNVKMRHFLSQKKGFRKPKKWCALRSEPGPDFNQPWMCFFEEKSAKFGLGVRSNILLPHIGGSHPVPSLSILSRERRSTANYTHTHTHTHLFGSFPNLGIRSSRNSDCICSSSISTLVTRLPANIVRFRAFQTTKTTMRRTWRIFLGLLVQLIGEISGIIGDFFWISLFLYFSPQISLIFSLSNATLRGSHGLSTRSARRTKSSRPEGPPRLPVLHNVENNSCNK